MNKFKVLVAGRNGETLEAMKRMLSARDGLDVSVRVMFNGHADPLDGVGRVPDVLILQHGEGDQDLAALTRRPAADRVPLIVFGPADDAAAIRQAMRAGASDYLSAPVQEDELRAALARVAEERLATPRANEGSLHVIMNGKGGSGASFLAANLAHGLTQEGHTVTLVDLDLQFASLSRYLDLEPERGLFEALEGVEEMDELSARAFTCEHSSGLRLLSARSEGLRLNEDVAPERLVALLRTYRSLNDFVIVDLPRHIDVLNAAVLENADHVSVVLQQSVPHLHDTARLLDILRSQVGVDDSRISVVLNRYAKDSAVTVRDIEKALRIDDPITIPNQYKLVAESIDSGIPLADMKKNAQVARGLRQLCQRIGGTEEPAGGFLSKAFPTLLRR